MYPDQAGVVTVFFQPAPQQDALGSFLKDLADACEQASFANDDAAGRDLWRLWLRLFQEELVAKPVNRLIDFLETRQVWQTHEAWPVFKTAGLPCITFTAQVSDDETQVTLIALGACYRYPDNQQLKWWTDVIGPRVRSL